MCGHDDLVSIENSHQLGDRQFGVAISGVEIDGQLGLCAAHRLQNRNKFFLHRDYSTLLRTPRLHQERSTTLSVSGQRSCEP
jgi:hypothetical protein